MLHIQTPHIYHRFASTLPTLPHSPRIIYPPPLSPFTLQGFYDDTTTKLNQIPITPEEAANTRLIFNYTPTDSLNKVYSSYTQEPLILP